MQHSRRLFLGIDQGTQSTRAIVFDDDGGLVVKSQVAISIDKRSALEVEQNGEEIRRSLDSCLQEIFDAVDPADIQAAGLASQRSSVIAWNGKTGEPLSPVLSWRDRRGKAFVETLQPHAKLVQKKTGLRLSAYYGASKIHWLLRNHRAVQQALATRTLRIGPLAGFLVDALCMEKPYLVDHANALRTQLLHLETLHWDEELLRLFEIPAGLLPKPVPTAHFFGNLKDTGIPLLSVNGDQTAALYSLGEMHGDEILVNLGTGGFVLCPVANDTAIPEGLLGGISRSTARGQSRLIEGTVNGCGSALNWYRESIGRNAPFDIDACLQGFGGELIFLNGINGMGSPFWQDIEPVFMTITDRKLVANPDPDQAVAAIVESILFLVQINIKRIQTVKKIQAIRLTGGLSNSRNICRLLANLSGIPVMRPDITEATARGAAWLASGTKKTWPPGPGTLRFTPNPDEALQKRFLVFREQVGSETRTH